MGIVPLPRWDAPPAPPSRLRLLLTEVTIALYEVGLPLGPIVARYAGKTADRLARHLDWQPLHRIPGKPRCPPPSVK
jgi:hypothetical protein